MERVDKLQETSELSLKWSPERIFTVFYNRGKPHYNEQYQALFSLYESKAYVTDSKLSEILATIGGLGDHITTICVNSTGTILVACCSSFLFRVYQFDWDALKRARSRTNDEFATNANCAPDSLSEKLQDTVLTRRNLLPVREIRSWKGPQVLSTCSVMSSDHSTITLIAAGFTDGSLYIYDVATGNCTHKFPKHSENIGAIKFHPRRHLLFSTSSDGEIRVHDLYRHITIAKFIDHLSLPTDFDFILRTSSNSDSSSLLQLGGFASCSRDMVANIWNLDSLDSLFLDKVTQNVENKNISKPLKNSIKIGFPLSNVEKQFLTYDSRLGCKDSKKKNKATDTLTENRADIQLIQNWYSTNLCDDPLSLEPVHQLTVHESVESICCLSSTLFSNCSFKKQHQCIQALKDICPWVIVVGGESGNLTLWDPSTRKKLLSLDTIHKRNGTIVSLKYHVSPTGAPWLICASSDNIIVFWNLRTLREDRIMLGSGRELIHCQFVNIPPSHFLESYKQNESFLKVAEMDHPVQNKSLFKQFLLLRSDPSCVLLQMSSTQTTASILNGHTDTVLSADCTENGCWIVSGSKDHTIRIWSTLIKQCVAIYDIHAAPVTNVKVNACIKTEEFAKCSCHSTNDSTFQNKNQTTFPSTFFGLSVCLDGILKLFTVDCKALTKMVDNYLSEKVSDQTFNISEEHQKNENPKPNGIQCIIVKESERSVIAHEKEINALAIAPNNKMAATGSSDKTIKLWALPSLEFLGACRGHSRPVLSLNFSPIEKVIASGSGDGTIRLWNLKDFSCLKIFQLQQTSVLSLDYLTYGTQLVSSSGDGQLKLWNIRTSECVGSFDHHNSQKVWSISVDKSFQKHILSAAADHTFILWKDVTDVFQKQQAIELQKEAADILEINSLTKCGEVFKALSLSIKRGRMHQTQTILEHSFQSRLLKSYDNETSLTTSSPHGALKVLTAFELEKKIPFINTEEIGNWLCELSDDLLKNFFEFIVKWNTNGKTSNLANFLLNIIFQYIPNKKLMCIEGFPSLASAFSAYISRHISRIDGLLQRTFLVDMIFLTSNGKSYLSVPEFPLRASQDTESQAETVPLSLSDTYKTFFDV